jgi:hypothetical protein
LPGWLGLIVAIGTTGLFLFALKQTVNPELYCYEYDWESNPETGAIVWPKSRCEIE